MSMNVAAVARVGAYLLVGVVVGTMALAGHPRVQQVERWPDQLQRADAALAAGDLRAAQDAWQEAHRAVMGARSPEGLLEAGRAYLRVGEAAHGREAARAQARRVYLAALFQARARGDAETVAHVAQAFAMLGDHAVSERAFAVALTLAGHSRDAGARDRIAALRTPTN
jgi:tetratricopeptide (TPR) repeat protein